MNNILSLCDKKNVTITKNRVKNLTFKNPSMMLPVLPGPVKAISF